MKGVFEEIKDKMVPTIPDLAGAITQYLVFNSSGDKLSDVAVDDPLRGFFDNAVESGFSSIKGIDSLSGLEKDLTAAAMDQKDAEYEDFLNPESLKSRNLKELF